MGLLNLFKGKKKETSKPVQEETDTEELSNPGRPTADTVDLVSVIAIDDPFLITKEGAFVLMFEIPEIDMDIRNNTVLHSGQTMMVLGKTEYIQKML